MASSIRPRDRSHRRHPRRRPGHAHALAHAQGPARPVRAADGRVAGAAPLGGRRGQGRRRRRARSAPLDGRLPEGVELAVQPERQRHRRRRPGGAPGSSATTRRARASAATCRSSPPRRSPRCSRRTRPTARRRRWPRWSSTTPRGYGRVVRARRRRGRSASSRRRRRRRHGGELAIREVNAGVYAFDGAALWPALAAPDARQRPGRALPARTSLDLLDGDGGRSAVDDPDVLLGVNDRVDARRRARARPARASTRRHMRAGVTIVDPASDADRRRRRDRRGHGRRALLLPARRDAIGARCRIGPLTTIIDTTLGDEVTVLHSYLVELRRARTGVSVGPFAYLRPGHAPARAARRPARSSRSRTPTSASGTKVPHLSLHRRHRRRAPTPTSAPRRSPRTTTARRKHRTTIGARRAHERRHDASSRRSRSATARTTAAGSVITEDVPPGALGDRARAPDQRRGLRRPPQGATASSRTRRRDRRVEFGRSS